SFEQRHAAILEGERAALAALPRIRASIAAHQRTRLEAARRKAEGEAAAQPADVDCGDSWVRRRNPFARDRPGGGKRALDPDQGPRRGPPRRYPRTHRRGYRGRTS